MGLAASQARFLGLTARKSNIEYEGQQVNQQRTALAEEVNALYNKLAGMSLPVAPDATQYYSSNYSFSMSNTKEQAGDGDYIVKSYYKNDDGTYYVNTSRTYNKNTASGTAVNNDLIGYDEEKGVYTYSYNGKTVELKAATDSKDMIAKINDAYPNEKLDENDSLYIFSDSDGLTHYFSKAQMDNRKDPSQKISDYTRINKKVTEPKVFEKASIKFDANNRIASITIDNQTMDVNTTRVYNSDGYDAALRDYTMSKDEYNKRVQELNAETESLQQEDKILEMRLDQISTEQNELKTELDAVKQILKDNIEATFKTFTG